METVFERAKGSDLNTILTLARSTIDRSYRYFLGNLTVDRYLSSGRLDDYLIKNIENTWVISYDYKIVGFSVCLENIIDFMLIDADFHRQGVGTQLLLFCEAMLFEDHHVIALESFENNTKANNFYLTNDWRVTEKYKDPKSNAIKLIFRKQLYSHVELQRQTALHPNPFK